MRSMITLAAAVVVTLSLVGCTKPEATTTTTVAAPTEAPTTTVAK